MKNQWKFIEKSFNQENVKYQNLLDYSSPTRLTIWIKGLPERITIPSKEIKGPKVGVMEDILNKFIRANNVTKKDIFEHISKKKKLGNVESVKANKSDQIIELSRLAKITADHMINSKKTSCWHSLEWKKHSNKKLIQIS